MNVKLNSAVFLAVFLLSAVLVGCNGTLATPAPVVQEPTVQPLEPTQTLNGLVVTFTPLGMTEETTPTLVVSTEQPPEEETQEVVMVQIGNGKHRAGLTELAAYFNLGDIREENSLILQVGRKYPAVGLSRSASEFWVQIEVKSGDGVKKPDGSYFTGKLWLSMYEVTLLPEGRSWETVSFLPAPTATPMPQE